MIGTNKKNLEYIFISGIALLSAILWALLGFLSYVLTTATILTDQEQILDFLQNRSMTNTFMGFGILFILSLISTTVLITKIKNITS